jgi:hypothetical protein
VDRSVDSGRKLRYVFYKFLRNTGINCSEKGKNLIKTHKVDLEVPLGSIRCPSIPCGYPHQDLNI